MFVFTLIWLEDVGFQCGMIFSRKLMVESVIWVQAGWKFN